MTFRHKAVNWNKEDDNFTGLKMSSFGMYQDIDAKLVELYDD